MNVTVREMVSGDWDAVQRIYQDGIDTGVATFQPGSSAFFGGGAGYTILLPPRRGCFGYGNRVCGSDAGLGTGSVCGSCRGEYLHRIGVHQKRCGDDSSACVDRRV